jgi:predicted kinase
MLIILGGLPGSGKSTIAKLLAAELRAAYVRVDTIEQALVASGEASPPINVAGYAVAYGIAADCLRSGAIVVADSVNPLAVTREAWLDVARRADHAAIEIGVICSDPTEHRRRVESRAADIPGHVQPTWQEVLDREFEPWGARVVVIDTAQLSVAAAVRRIVDALPHHQH